MPLDQRLAEDRRMISITAMPRYFAALMPERVLVVEHAIGHPAMAEVMDLPRGGNRLGALMDATVRVDGRLVGILCCEHFGAPRKWAQDEVNFAGSLADLIALALVGRNAGVPRPPFWTPRRRPNWPTGPRANSWPI
ncbi:GAF domain-containing protein [Tistrella bauzanensis]